MRSWFFQRDPAPAILPGPHPRALKKRLTSPSLWLFVMVGLVYLANGRPIPSGDTLPARYLPFSLLREHNFDLDEFPFLYGEEALRTYPLLDGVPYFLRYRDGHYLSAYSPGAAIVALPVYALPVLFGIPPASLWAPRLEKLSATVIAALSVVFLHWTLGALLSRGWALAISAIYAFGTSSWSVSSQALWQHGPSQLFLALLLYCLMRGVTNERFLIYAGFAMSAAVVMRPTDLLIVLPVAAWILYTHRHLTIRVIQFALPPAAAFALYNLAVFGSAGGGSGHTTTPTWALFTQVPLREGLAGLLVSPSRGLFVYSPVLLFALFGFVWIWRRGPSPFKPLTLGVALVILVVSKWFLWWGGHTWGPRLLADTAPIFCFFLYPVIGYVDRHRLLKGVFVFFAALSIGTHALGAFFYDGRWDATANVGRDESPLWSWRDGPLVFYGREARSLMRALIRLNLSHPTSADSPNLLAASYAAGPIPSESFTGESFVAAVTATNTGRAVWLAIAPGDRGAVRLGWRWVGGDLAAFEGRATLSSDVSPGQVVHFTARIPSPLAPGDYTLTIDLVSELVTWFAGQNQPAVSGKVRVLSRDPARLLSEVVEADGTSARVSISTDRMWYRRADSLRLTVDLLNPHHPGKFDAYLVLERSDGAVWFYDGRHPPQLGSWAPWGREFPLPARATGKFTLPLSMFADGVYRWQVVLTEAGTYRGLAKAATGFTIGE
jgi:hypothetical protein